MEDRKVPWWRKALSFALSGFRSGFGLFSRTQKNDVDHKPEFVAGLEINPKEEAELIKDSPKLEAISEAETEGVAVFVADAASLAAMIETDGAAVQAAESLKTSAQRIEAVAEKVPVKTTEQPAEVEH